MAHPSYISHVDNQHNGCFVACAAMILGVPYDQAFKLTHPKRNPNDHRGGFVSPTRALKKLEQWGLKPRVIQIDSIRNLKQTALIWIRWSPRSALMHSYVYEHKTKQFWDPNVYNPISKWGIDEADKLKETVVLLDGYKPGPGMPPPKPSPFRYSYGYGSEYDYDF